MLTARAEQVPAVLDYNFVNPFPTGSNLYVLYDLPVIREPAEISYISAGFSPNECTSTLSESPMLVFAALVELQKLSLELDSLE